MKPIEINLGNQSYQIRSHDALNIVVERLVEVDPTKSPAFDPEKHSADVRLDWREPSYYSTVEKALVALPDRVMRNSDAETLAELIDELHELRHEIRRLMRGE